MKQIIFNGKKNVIADQVRLLRIRRGLSQVELAARMQTLGCNVDQQIISKIEKNQRQVTDYELACFCICLKAEAAALLKDFFASIESI
ncbi:MAG: helix-turn-helix domain-containing protein [Clostridia bacterium]|nr:helix-turn-helix domain-containing protein [Clostridia bacterium]